MDGARTRRRRLLSWLPSFVLILTIVGFAVATVGVNSSWWVEPNPAPAADQAAPNGSSVFTDAGVDYLIRAGVVRIRMDDGALPAEALGLNADGTRTVDTRGRPVLVQVVGTDGALAVDGVTALMLRTEDGELVSVEATRPVPGGFVAARAMLRDVADLYGWSPEDVSALPDRVARQRREQPEEPTSVTVGPGAAVGLSVSATLTVDGGTELVFAVRPAPG